MIELSEKSGILSLGGRPCWLSDNVTRDAAEINKLYGLEIKPKCFPVLRRVLSNVLIADSRNPVYKILVTKLFSHIISHFMCRN